MHKLSCRQTNKFNVLVYFFSPWPGSVRMCGYNNFDNYFGNEALAEGTDREGDSEKAASDDTFSI